MAEKEAVVVAPPMPRELMTMSIEEVWARAYESGWKAHQQAQASSSSVGVGGGGEAPRTPLPALNALSPSSCAIPLQAQRVACRATAYSRNGIAAGGGGGGLAAGSSMRMIGISTRAVGIIRRRKRRR